MANLNELWHYEDETDRWAARREFLMRRERWRTYLVGTAMAQALAKVEDMGRAFGRIGTAARKASRSMIELQGIPAEWLDER